jgi:hypothetical protein
MSNAPADAVLHDDGDGAPDVRGAVYVENSGSLAGQQDHVHGRSTTTESSATLASVGEQGGNDREVPEPLLKPKTATPEPELPAAEPVGAPTPGPSPGPELVHLSDEAPAPEPLPEPVHALGVSESLSTAFYELHHALNVEALVNGPGYPRRPTRRGHPAPLDTDHEIQMQRMKQLRAAAHVVLGLWEALKKGPDESLAVPLNWARSVVGGPFEPMHPKKKLSVAKDYLRKIVEDAVLGYEDIALRVAPRPTGRPTCATEDQTRNAPIKELAIDADHLRLGEATSDRGDALYYFAFHIALSLLDPQLFVIRDLLPKRDLQASALNITETLMGLSEEQFADTELLLRRVLRGLGLPPNAVHDFFSYDNKRSKRQPG